MNEAIVSATAPPAPQLHFNIYDQTLDITCDIDNIVENSIAYLRFDVQLSDEWTPDSAQNETIDYIFQYGNRTYGPEEVSIFPGITYFVPKDVIQAPGFIVGAVMKRVNKDTNVIERRLVTAPTKVKIFPSGRLEPTAVSDDEVKSWVEGIEQRLDELDRRAVQGDWNQDQLVAPDFVKNKTHYRYTTRLGVVEFKTNEMKFNDAERHDYMFAWSGKTNFAPGQEYFISLILGRGNTVSGKAVFGEPDAPLKLEGSSKHPPIIPYVIEIYDGILNAETGNYDDGMEFYIYTTDTAQFSAFDEIMTQAHRVSITPTDPLHAFGEFHYKPLDNKYLPTEIQELPSRVTTNEQALVSHNTRITNNENDLTSHNTRITNNETITSKITITPQPTPNHTTVDIAGYNLITADGMIPSKLLVNAPGGAVGSKDYTNITEHRPQIGGNELGPDNNTYEKLELIPGYISKKEPANAKNGSIWIRIK